MAVLCCVRAHRISCPRRLESRSRKHNIIIIIARNKNDGQTADSQWVVKKCASTWIILRDPVFLFSIVFGDGWHWRWSCQQELPPAVKRMKQRSSQILEILVGIYHILYLGYSMVWVQWEEQNKTTKKKWLAYPFDPWQCLLPVYRTWLDSMNVYTLRVHSFFSLYIIIATGVSYILSTHRFLMFRQSKDI